MKTHPPTLQTKQEYNLCLKNLGSFHSTTIQGIVAETVHKHDSYLTHKLHFKSKECELAITDKSGSSNCPFKGNAVVIVTLTGNERKQQVRGYSTWERSI